MVVQRMIVGLLLLSVGCAVRADWQYTKWGMTQEQVRAAGTSVKEGTDRSDRTTLDFALEAPYVAAGHEFRAAFGFDRQSGTLSAVVLHPTNDSECLTIRGDITSKYGDPFSEDRNQVAATKIWKDAKERNRVEFTEIPMVNSCSITYKPIDVDANNGL